MSIEKHIEIRAAHIVAYGQWSVSGIIVAALMVSFLGVPVWDWLRWSAAWYVAIMGPAWLVIGMALCWRLVDGRRWIVVPVEIFIIVCGLGLLHLQVQHTRQAQSDAERQAFFASAEYITARDAYSVALADKQALVNRTTSIPGNFTTGARENKTAKTEADTALKEAKADLIKVEKTAPTAVQTSAAETFDIFGAANAWWVEAVILLFLGLGNEGIALAISWTRRNGSIPEPTQDQNQAVPERSAKVPWTETEVPILEEKKTWEDYLAEAKRGRADRRLNGREEVAKALGISERQTRKLYLECVAMGKIIPGKALETEIKIDATHISG